MSHSVTQTYKRQNQGHTKLVTFGECSSTCPPQQDGLTLTKFCAFRHLTSVPVHRIFDFTNTALIECDSVMVTATDAVLKKASQKNYKKD